MSGPIDGLDELIEQLRQLPRELTDEASSIMEAFAQKAEREIYNAYPDVTGDLRDHLSTKTERTEFGVIVTVKNSSKLAYIYENGTAARHYITKRNGVKHLTGAMPVGNAFIPPMSRNRRAAYEAIAKLMEAKGLEVTGDATS
jgi:hypothetical protein